MIKRSIRAIYVRAQKLKIPSDQWWTEEQKNIVKEFYPLEGVDGCFKRMNQQKTKTAIKGYVTKNGIIKIAYQRIYCIETEQTYNSIQEIMEQLNLSRGQISDCCRGVKQTAGGYHLCYYKDKDSYKLPEPNKEFCRKIYCVELNKIFSSMSAAEKELGISHANISSCCNGKRQTAGGYHWCYAENQDNYVIPNKKPNRAKAVKCCETQQVYESGAEACRILGLNENAIGKACRTNKTAGGYHWEYIDNSEE